MRPSLPGKGWLPGPLRVGNGAGLFRGSGPIGATSRGLRRFSCAAMGRSVPTPDPSAEPALIQPRAGSFICYVHIRTFDYTAAAAAHDARMPSREELQKEIDWLVQIIRTNEASLKLKTLSALERTLLEAQIKTRGLTLAGLRQKLADLSGAT